MNRTDCIELVHQLTERKAEKILDMNLLFSTTVQDICKRSRFWWRKQDITFTLTKGTTTYDFTAITTTPAITEIAVEEIVVLSLILQTSPTLNSPELTPIFDSMGIRAMKQNAQQGQPSRYTMGVDDWKTLRIDPPDQTYTAEMTFYAMPIISKDQSSNVIPLIPPFYHDAVVNGMEARVNKRVYGPNDVRYKDSKASFEECILRMMMRPQFTSNIQKQWTTQDDATLNGAVQSTAPNSP